MTLFTTLLVLIAERLFKLGEHWQLDHRLEVAFRRIKHFSLPGTLLMTLVAVAVVYIIQRLLQGQLFNIPLLVFWILLGLAMHWRRQSSAALPCLSESGVAQ